MQVEVVPLTDFVHGSYTANEGRQMELPDGIARDLERRGLVRIAMVPRRVDQALAMRSGAAIVGTEAGKAPDDGKGQPSSALPAAPASPTTTLHASRPGKEKRRKAGT